MPSHMSEVRDKKREPVLALWISPACKTACCNKIDDGTSTSQRGGLRFRAGDELANEISSGYTF